MTLSPKALLATPGGWHLPQTARVFEKRQALAGLWISNKNSTQVSADKYRRCWPLHLALKPLMHFAPQILEEKAFYALFPIWKTWFQAQRFPECNVVQAIMGFATEPFDQAAKCGALKVVDAPNSHPTTYRAFWQRECDLWCAGEKIPIPDWIFNRMRLELERADLVLCPSLFVRDTMVANGIAPEKCLVNPFGVNTEVFKPRQEVPTRPKFVSIGTICVRKGFQYLFRALELVRQKLPEAELVVVGDYKTDFRRERPRWEGAFTHFPNLAHTELAQLLQTCTAFVFPSQEEGFARVIPEAMAAGLPVLASYESGATTLVEDGVQGIIVKGRDPEHIAAAMVRVATDLQLNRSMGEAAHKKGAVSNTWQDYGDRLLAEYTGRLQR